MIKLAFVTLALITLAGCIATNGKTTGFVSDDWSLVATYDSEGRISVLHGEGPEGSGDWLPTKKVKGLASIKDGNRATVTLTPVYDD